jgi:hypothetical protein
VSIRFAGKLLSLDPLIARLLRVLERLPRIAMRATWPPVFPAFVALTVTGPVPLTDARAIVAIPASESPITLGGRLLWRRPQLAAREPLHLGVGLFFLEARERRQ